MAEKVEPHPKMSGMGARIRMIRESKHLSQTDLADLAGMSQGAISAYERDAVDGVPLAHVMRIADALETTVQWIAYGEAISGPTAKRYRRRSE